VSLKASAGWSAAATEGHTYFRQMFACDLAGNILASLPVDASENISITSNLVRRVATLVIPNDALGTYTPASGGLLDLVGRSFLVRFGITLPDGTALTCDQPLLFPDSDETDVAGHLITIPVSDGMRVVGANAQVGGAVNFPDGTPLETVARTALVACGVADVDSNFDLQSGGQTLVGVHAYETGTYWQDILNTILADATCDLWAAAPCVYTLRPIPDPTIATPVATWQMGSQVRMAGFTRRRTSAAKNHAVVNGIDPYGQPVTAEAFDLNPSSPVRYGASGVGDLLITYTSDGITSYTQALAKAQSLLTINAMQIQYDAVVPVDPSLDRRDVIRIIEPSTSTDSLVMLDSFPLPLAPGTQTITVNQARSLS
jgi:hypothetical protein